MKINEVIVDPVWSTFEKIADTERDLVARIEGLHQMVMVSPGVSNLTPDGISNLLAAARLYQASIDPDIMQQSRELLSEVIRELDQDHY